VASHGPIREASCGFQADERAMKTLVMAAAGLALLVLIVFVGLYTYTDTAFP
jgi:hypothetical protein